MAVLKLLRGGAIGQTLPLQGERVVLGRHPSCQIVLDDASVSRHHAQILENHGTYYLEDLRSRNGTQLNDETIRGRVEIRDGDQIKLCDYVFQFLMTSSVYAPTPAPRPYERLSAAERIRETAPDFVVGDEEEPAAFADEGSSILSRMEVDSVQTIRLNVRPEVKLRAILEISRVLGRVLEVDAVLPRILDALFKIFPQADWGFVLLEDPATGRPRVRASKARRAGEEDSIPLSQTIVAQAMATGESILSADASRDRRFSTSESLLELQIRSVMCAPLRNQAGKSLGVIQVSTRDLLQQFNSDDLELLSSVTSQCALAIENAALHESVVAQRDIERELDFATQVQLGFLPSESPALTGYEFADYYEPAHRVGGDYFDYIRLPNGNIAIALGDVAGKGIPAALLMARLHASARYHLLSAMRAGDALTSLNAEIMTSGLGFRFITLVLAIIDVERHELRLANAGHLPPLLRSREHSVTPIGMKESGMPLGVTGHQNFQEIAVPFAPGDTLLFYTDGLTEAMNSANEIFGRVRLSEVFGSAPERVAELVPYLAETVERYAEGGSQRDDLCMVAVSRRE